MNADPFIVCQKLKTEIFKSNFEYKRNNNVVVISCKVR